MLNIFWHPPLAQPQYLSHKHTTLNYGIQVAQPKDTTTTLSGNEQKHVQEILAVLIYYSCAVDPTLACALS